MQMEDMNKRKSELMEKKEMLEEEIKKCTKIKESVEGSL